MAGDCPVSARNVRLNHDPAVLGYLNRSGKARDESGLPPIMVYYGRRASEPYFGGRKWDASRELAIPNEAGTDSAGGSLNVADEN